MKARLQILITFWRLHCHACKNGLDALHTLKCVTDELLDYYMQFIVQSFLVVCFVQWAVKVA